MRFPTDYDKETPLQRDCQAYLEHLSHKGVPVNIPYKTHGNMFTQSGISDILVCIYGIFCALECKVKNRKATPAQLRYLKRTNDSGGIGAIIRHPLEIEGVVRRAFDKANFQGRGEGTSST